MSDVQYVNYLQLTILYVSFFMYSLSIKQCHIKNKEYLLYLCRSSIAGEVKDSGKYQSLEQIV